MSSESLYQDRAQRFAQAEQGWARLDRQLARARLAVFCLIVVLLGLGAADDDGRLWYWAGGLVFVGFLGLIAYHEYVARQRQVHRALQQINCHAVSRVRRSWQEFPAPHVAVPEEHTALAHDLDLFGRGSLFQLLCTAGTSIGRHTVRDWLLQPAAVDVIRLRQQAVRELAGQLELRESLQLQGQLLTEGKAGPTAFIAWAEGQPWLWRRPGLSWTVRCLPLAMVLVCLLTVAGWVAAETGGITIAVLLLGNAALSVLFTGTVHEIFQVVSTRNGEVRRYRAMFQLLYSMPESTAELARIKRELTARGGGVQPRLAVLQRIMMLANMSHSPLMFVLCYLPLQLTVLWDFQVLAWLERWQATNGEHVRAWFAALGQFEALSSLATLSHDQPDWSFPECDRQQDRVRANQLGHPLLPAESRVGNDLEVGPAGTFLLVTGSNMSGKSTLLRSLGTNVILAQAGAPVCAARLVLPPLAVASSMRIHDSLQDGVSFFMAELRRLKVIVDQAHDFAQRDDRGLLYMLDEILQGTNSRERHIAVVRVLAHLLECGAIGAISTHDLDLASSAEIRKSCRPVHFRETLHEPDAPRPMTFDYCLRPGVATTTNALRLLEIVGLGSSKQ